MKLALLLWLADPLQLLFTNGLEIAECTALGVMPKRQIVRIAKPERSPTLGVSEDGFSSVPDSSLRKPSSNAGLASTPR